MLCNKSCRLTLLWALFRPLRETWRITWQHRWSKLGVQSIHRRGWGDTRQRAVTPLGIGTISVNRTDTARKDRNILTAVTRVTAQDPTRQNPFVPCLVKGVTQQIVHTDLFVFDCLTNPIPSPNNNSPIAQQRAERRTLHKKETANAVLLLDTW